MKLVKVSAILILFIFSILSVILIGCPRRPEPRVPTSPTSDDKLIIRIHCDHTVDASQDITVGIFDSTTDSQTNITGADQTECLISLSSGVGTVEFTNITLPVAIFAYRDENTNDSYDVGTDHKGETTTDSYDTIDLTVD